MRCSAVGFLCLATLLCAPGATAGQPDPTRDSIAATPPRPTTALGADLERRGLHGAALALHLQAADQEAASLAAAVRLARQLDVEVVLDDLQPSPEAMAALPADDRRLLQLRVAFVAYERLPAGGPEARSAVHAAIEAMPDELLAPSRGSDLLSLRARYLRALLLVDGGLTATAAQELLRIAETPMRHVPRKQRTEARALAARAGLDQARLHYRAQQYARAESAAARLAQPDDVAAEALVMRAWIAFIEDRTDDGVQLLQEVVERWPRPNSWPTAIAVAEARHLAAIVAMSAGHDSDAGGLAEQAREAHEQLAVLLAAAATANGHPARWTLDHDPELAAWHRWQRLLSSELRHLEDDGSTTTAVQAARHQAIEARDSRRLEVAAQRRELALSGMRQAQIVSFETTTATRADYEYRQSAGTATAPSRQASQGLRQLAESGQHLVAPAAPPPLAPRRGRAQASTSPPRPAPSAHPCPATRGTSRLRQRRAAAAAEAPRFASEVSAEVHSDQDTLSTFALDVDTSSYTHARSLVTQGRMPAPADVRVEEFVNYFDYGYAGPEGAAPIGAQMDLCPHPWRDDRVLLRVGLQAKRDDSRVRAPVHLHFLVDVSGSMNVSDRLPLARTLLLDLVGKLGDEDTISLSTYAGGSRLVLPATPTTRRAEIEEAILQLRSGGSHGHGRGHRAGVQASRGLACRRRREPGHRALGRQRERGPQGCRKPRCAHLGARRPGHHAHDGDLRREQPGGHDGAAGQPGRRQRLLHRLPGRRAAECSASAWPARCARPPAT